MTKTQIVIRHATISDLAGVQQLFVDTISVICRDDYSPEQIKAWISSVENKKRWTEKLNAQYFIVGELDGNIVGYASLDGTDYLDFLYVHKDYQRQGIASKLYLEIEKEANRRNSKALYADVSKTAKPFFEARGFNILQAQTVIIQEVELTNFRMSKPLNGE